MRSMILPLLMTMGCAASPVPSTVAGTLGPSPPPFDDAHAVSRVHMFFDAVDARDRAALTGLVGEGFFLFEEGYLMGADALSARWPAHRTKAPARRRQCKNEQIRRASGAIIYLGDCSEHETSSGDQPARQWQGWSLVVLTPESGSWRVAVWQWQESGIEVMRHKYNEIYRKGDAYVSEPNSLLASAVAAESPGKAFVLAMGEGRNALYLASRGWKVTGIDISDEGLRAARRAAEERGLEVETLQADIDKFDFGKERWDLVTMIYAGGDTAWIERSKESLKPGGLFVFEFQIRRSGNQSVDPFAGVARGSLARQFKGWTILRNDEADAIADWGRSKAPLARFVARKPRTND